MLKKQTAKWIPMLFLVLLWQAREASAYGGASLLGYNPQYDQLSGYTATWKDWWDGDYSDCLFWDYDWEYEEWYCASWGYWQNSVAVDGYVYTPSWSPYASGSAWGSSYAEWDLSPSTPSENGTWTIGGDHYEVQAMYISDGWYWYYAGTWTNYLGSTAWQENVLPCGDERGNIIREYKSGGQGFPPVNWTPGCSDFATSGFTSNFSWSELNRYPGSGHPPYGIVRSALWSGLENTRSNYNRGGIVIDSGYRCPHGNFQVGGAGQSRHMWGDAGDMHSADHSWSFDEWDLLQRAARAAGASFIEPYGQDPSHVHADWR